MVSDYLQERRDNKVLDSRIVETEQILALMPPPPSDLELRLSAAQLDFESARQEFPEPLNTTGIIDGILRIADETGVKAIPMVTQPWTVEDISDYHYSVFRLSVTATGTFTRLAGFINRLESAEPRTLVIESLVANRITETAEEEDIVLFEARMEIAVYARPALDEE